MKTWLWIALLQIWLQHPNTLLYFQQIAMTTLLINIFAWETSFKMRTVLTIKYSSRWIFSLILFLKTFNCTMSWIKKPSNKRNIWSKNRKILSWSLFNFVVHGHTMLWFYWAGRQLWFNLAFLRIFMLAWV